MNVKVWNKRQVIEHIRDGYYFLQVPERLQVMIEEAVTSQNWDFFTQSDGCTLINENWVNGYFPPCIVHDYLRQNKIGKPLDQDLIFKDLLTAYKRPRLNAFLLFVGVRLVWYIFRK